MLDINRDRMQRADDIYDRLRDQLEPRHKGEIVAIEIDSGDYFLGRDELEAYDKGVRKYPDKTFIYKRVGFPTAHIVGAL